MYIPEKNKISSSKIRISCPKIFVAVGLCLLSIILPLPVLAIYLPLTAPPIGEAEYTKDPYHGGWLPPPPYCKIVNYSVESPHPYPAYYKYQWTITQPKAVAIQLHFSKIDVHFRDAICIADGNNRVFEIINGTATDYWAAPVWGDTVNLYFKADWFYTESWGFQVDKYAWDQGIKIEITQVTPPNDNVSFTTKAPENRIHCLADIKPDYLYAVYNSQIKWEIDDNPVDKYQSGNPDNPQTGDEVDLEITIPPVPTAPKGRGFRLSYRIIAFGTIEGYTYTSTLTFKDYLWQDERDQCRQEYIDVEIKKKKARRVPQRTEFVNFDTYVDPGHFPFDEINSTFNPSYLHMYDPPKYHWVIFTIAQHLENIRGKLTKNPVMPVNSGYRNPLKNASLPNSALNSLHIYGRAADIGLRDWNGDGKVSEKDHYLMEKLAKKEGAVEIEDFVMTPTWIHMGWKD